MAASAREQYTDLRHQLEAIGYPPEEASAVARALLTAICGVTDAAWHLKLDELTLSEAQQTRYRAAVARLKQGEPLQYVLGEAPFGPLVLSVEPVVLIPRPETEELCSRIVSAQKLGEKAQNSHTDKGLRILDLGCGSGAISLYLAYILKNSVVYSIEKSGDALAIARQNAARYSDQLAGTVYFLQGDMLHPETFASHLEPIDIIVSNPPYVTEAEKAYLEPRVAAYEPAEALFAPPEDALFFYRAIARLLSQIALNDPCSLYLELNSTTAEQTLELFRNTKRCTSVQIERDLSGKQRFLEAIIEDKSIQ